MTQHLTSIESSQKLSTEPPSSSLVSSRNVEEALILDKGQDAHLASWTTKDFTSKGDNYVSVITSVVIKFAFGQDVQEVTYVVKIKQMKENGSASDFDNMVFKKEGKFFSELLPLLNLELANIGQDHLKMPRFFHDKWLDEQNQLFLEDLRSLKFKLYDRKKGLDFQHTKLVLQELSRLHAASFLLQSKTPKRRISQDFNFLNWEWFTYSEKLKKTFEVLVSGGLLTAAILAKKLGKEKVSNWYNKISTKGVTILAEQLKCDSPCFDVVSHGDCWINNLLFRYDNKGLPVDVMLLDLQFCRQSSLAVDLSYFIFASLERSERRDRLDEFLLTYYISFKTVMDAALVSMPFTLEELREEYQKKNLFGLIMGTLLMPNILCDPDDVQDFDAAVDGSAGSYTERKRHRTLRMLQSNAVFRQRFIGLLDDITQLVDLT